MGSLLAGGITIKKGPSPFSAKPSDQCNDREARKPEVKWPCIVPETKGEETWVPTGDHFLNIILVAQTLRTTINNWKLLKLRCFCKGKDMVNTTRITIF